MDLIIHNTHTTKMDYNSRLSNFKRKGKCGDPEFMSSSMELEEQTKILSDFVKSSKYTVVFTGAGISTSSGIHS